MRNEELIEEATERDGQPLRYRVAGMDCPSCVGKIETALRRLPGIDDVSLNYHSQTLRLRLVEATTSRGKLEGTIRSLGYGVELADHVRLVTGRSEEHTSELRSLMRISYAVFCLKKKNQERHKHKIE